jgi:pimeloyl-ACP methyl ester carboxylesterase
VKIVFIHGAWVGPSSWDLFAARYASRGVSCVAPPWPHDDRPVDQLRASPDERLAGIGVGELVEHYAAIVAAEQAPPVIVGHSFGGLIAQLLLDRGLGAAGVAIHPAPPKGVFPSGSAVRASWPVLSTWAGWKKILTMSYEQFRWGFGHQLDEAACREAYDRHVIPTPGRPFFQAAFAPFGSATAIDFRKPRPPLLILGGTNDRTVTASMNRANHAKYRGAADYQECEGRSHWTIAEPGWEQIADRVLDWALERTRKS